MKIPDNARRIVMSVSIGYEKHWITKKGLIEVMSNALDAVKRKTGEYEFLWGNGLATIRDNGYGMKMSDFTFGGHRDKGSDDIGRFGEGGKMFQLAAARDERECVINTVGFSAACKFEEDEAFETKVLVLYTWPNQKDKGTEVVVECSKDEFEWAMGHFIEFSGLTKLDSKIYQGESCVFVNGQRTCDSDTILAYNCSNKEMLNRDRAVIKHQVFLDEMKLILESTKSTKAISAYLDGWQNKPNAWEYHVQLNPKDKEAWKKVIKGSYANIAISSDVDSDFIAKHADYEVLRNVPNNVSSLLFSLGVPRTIDVARKYDRKNGIYSSLNNRMKYPISTHYAKNWTIRDAIREILANALDTGGKVQVSHKDGWATIKDDGPGLLKKHLILGESEKSSGKPERVVIGQFGEGAKLSSLEMARKKRNLHVETVGFSFNAVIEHDKEFDVDMLVLELSDNKIKKGTTVTFKCSKEELESAKDLFLHFTKNKKYKELSTDIFTPGGHVFLKGVHVMEIKSALSYNITDDGNKGLNRDRNMVDPTVMQDTIQRLLNHTESEEVVKRIFTAWREPSGANLYEYNSVIVRPETEVWKKVASKMFEYAVLPDDSDNIENDLRSKYAGYEVLKVPYVLSNLLRLCGTKRSHEIAKKHPGGILNGNRLCYPISDNYLYNHSVQDAIREIISNALDTKTKVKISYDDKRVTISDTGEGLKKEDLIYGTSRSRLSGSSIGAFGEGLKNSALILAKNDRNFRVVTAGFEFEAKIEYDQEFKVNILVLYLKNNKIKKGTQVSFDCKKEEIDDAKNLFTELSGKTKEVDKDILIPEGHLYVNGVQIQGINSFYSYNISNHEGKDLLTRDRRTVDIETAKPLILKVLSRAKNKKVIEAYLKKWRENTSYIEYSGKLSFNLIGKKVWAEVMAKVFRRKKTCLASTSIRHTLAAVEQVYEVLRPPEPVQELLKFLGMKYDCEAVHVPEDADVIKKRLKPKALSRIEKTIWEQSLEIYHFLYGPAALKKIELVEEFNEEYTSDNSVGLYFKGAIYVLRKTLKLGVYDPELRSKLKVQDEIMPEMANMLDIMFTVGTLCHEHHHHISGASDNTRDFENSLTSGLGRLAVLLNYTFGRMQKEHNQQNAPGKLFTLVPKTSKRNPRLVKNGNGAEQIKLAF